MRPKIYLFGDSITEESFGDGGWGASVAHHFSRSVTHTYTHTHRYTYIEFCMF